MKSKSMKIGNKEFVWGIRTYIMAIVNMTPDSFSGDGLLDSKNTRKRTNMLSIIEKALENGADIIDVGGESTRPGASIVSAAEEIKRVVPFIREITQNFDTLVSIDTYKAEVAKAALDAGAHLVNDVWGLKADKALAPLIATENVSVILMHNRSKPANAVVQKQLGGRYIGIEYQDLINDVKNELLESVQIAHRAGIKDDKIILDPGIGFGKTVEQNLILINKLDELKDLGYPVLLGPSRKSFIGYTLDLPPDQRLEGTSASIAIGIDRGADIIRIHDVKEMTRVARMTDAIVRS